MRVRDTSVLEMVAPSTCAAPARAQAEPTTRGKRSAGAIVAWQRSRTRNLLSQRSRRTARISPSVPLHLREPLHQTTVVGTKNGRRGPHRAPSRGGVRSGTGAGVSSPPKKQPPLRHAADAGGSRPPPARTLETRGCGRRPPAAPARPPTRRRGRARRRARGCRRAGAPAAPRGGAAAATETGARKNSGGGYRGRALPAAD